MSAPDGVEGPDQLALRQGTVPDWLPGLWDALVADGVQSAFTTLRPAAGARASAVLILIGESAAGPDILFTERASTLRKHAGQISFPGGGADPDDPDLIATALREATEETGLDQTGVEVIDTLPMVHVDVSGFDVTPVVAWWRSPGPVSAADPAEVSSVFRVPVAELADPANRYLVRHASGYTGPAFDVQGVLIWGLTAHMTDGILELAGWQEPWDQEKIMAVPDRFMIDRRPPIDKA